MADARKLEVYGKATALADDLRTEVELWRSFDMWTVGVQLVRSADSVGANLVEGLARRTRADQLQFLYVARASASEAGYWIERSMSRNLLTGESWSQRSTQVASMITGFIHSRAPLEPGVMSPTAKR